MKWGRQRRRRKRPAWSAGVVAALAAAWALALNGLLNLTTSLVDLRSYKWVLLAAALVATLATAVGAGVRAISAPAGDAEPARDAVLPAAGRDEARWLVPGPAADTVDRADVVADLVAKLTAGTGATVGVTTALRGAGGFGKTTIAQQVAAVPAVRRRFPGGAVWVTVGETAAGAELAAKVNDVSFQLSGQRPPLTDPEQAGLRLGELLTARPPTLVVVDDVWTRDQLQPFLLGSGTRLVTTRNWDVLPPGASAVRVDQMSRGQAYALLTRDLPELPEPVSRRLLRITGGWPLLLALVNRRLHADVHGADAPPERAAWRLAERLAADGPTTLDVSNEDSRTQAVGACLRASLDRLDTTWQARFRELGVCADGADLPRDLLTRLWGGAGGLSDVDVDRLAERLADLSLAVYYRPDTAGLRLHDVIRVWLRHEQGADALAGTHRRLVDAARALAAGPPEAAGTPWWRLPADARYWWQHLAHHLAGAGLQPELARLACDLRWVEAKNRHLGLAACEGDLSRVDTSEATALRRALAQSAHLLAPTDPAHAWADIVLSRLDKVAELDAVRHAYAATLPAAPRLRNLWPLPDVPHLALRRVLTGHDGWVRTCATSPDGSWVVTTGFDATVRIWDVSAGVQRTVMSGHSRPVYGCAVAPDGTWVLTAGVDGTARIWDADSGTLRQELAGHRGWVYGCAVAPDGSFVVTAGSDGTARIWDTATGAQRQLLAGHHGTVRACTVGPDGSWVVTAGSDGTARIWDADSGTLRQELAGHRGWVYGCAVAPDGSFVVTAGSDGTARIWDTATGAQRQILTGHGAAVNGCATASGGWVLTVGDDGTARIWDTATGTQRQILSGHDGWVYGCATAPDSTWVVTASSDRTARIWDVATGGHEPVPSGRHGRMYGCAAGQDGEWLVTAGDDGTARIWDFATGTQRVALSGHLASVNDCATSPGTSWIVTASRDGTARVWDVVTGAQRQRLTGHDGWVFGCAVAPDGTWVVTAGTDRTARIWDVGTGRQRLVLTGHQGWLYRCAVAPDGSWILTAAGDGTARIWDATTGKERHTFAGHHGRVYGCAISPDGTWAATAGRDGTTRLWDTATGTQRQLLTGHSGAVHDCAISPDGQWLATAGVDGTLRVWDTTTGTCHAALRVDGELDNCCWLPDLAICAVGSKGSYLFTYFPQQRAAGTRGVTVGVAPAAPSRTSASRGPGGWWR